MTECAHLFGDEAEDLGVRAEPGVDATRQTSAVATPPERAVAQGFRKAARDLAVSVDKDDERRSRVTAPSLAEQQRVRFEATAVGDGDQSLLLRQCERQPARCCGVLNRATPASTGSSAIPRNEALTSSPTSLPPRTNLRSKRCGGGETLASSGNPVAQLARDVLERDFCLLERAGTRMRLSDTAEMDQLGNYVEAKPGFCSSRLRQSRSVTLSSAGTESRCVGSVHAGGARNPDPAASPPDELGN